MYVLLHGARKNLGDYLIGDRCAALLTEHRPSHDLVRVPSWEPLTDHAATLAAADALIIAGGPGYQPHFWPGVYPLVDRPEDLPAPLVPMGLGWKGFPGDESTLHSYRFHDDALRVLRHVARGTRWMGCRDHFSVRALAAAGVDNGLMTGCPVWYHLPSIGRPTARPERVDRLVFTPAQRPLYRDQSVAMAEVLAELFPHAERVCSFHRGIDADDPAIPEADRRNNRFIADRAAALGFDVRDVSGDLDRIGFYAEHDLHVGYRVHAHIHFLSRRQPSLLLHEDGRGRGVDEALGIPGVPAWARTLRGHLVGRVSSRLTGTERKPPGAVAASESAPGQVRDILRGELTSGWARYAGLAATLDAHYDVMKRFLAALPGEP